MRDWFPHTATMKPIYQKRAIVVIKCLSLKPPMILIWLLQTGLLTHLGSARFIVCCVLQLSIRWRSLASIEYWALSYLQLRDVVPYVVVGEPEIELYEDRETPDDDWKKNSGRVCILRVYRGSLRLAWSRNHGLARCPQWFEASALSLPLKRWNGWIFGMGNLAFPKTSASSTIVLSMERHIKHDQENRSRERGPKLLPIAQTSRWIYLYIWHTASDS